MLHLACPAMPMILNLYCILAHLGIQFRSAGYVYILNSLQPDDARFGFNIYYNIFPDYLSTWIQIAIVLYICCSKYGAELGTVVIVLGMMTR